MPNTFKKRERHAGSDGKTKKETVANENGEQKAAEDSIFVPFTHDELNSYKTKMNKKAQKCAI